MNPLRSSPDTPEPELRQAIVLAGRIAYERGLLVSNDGNLSARMPDGNLLITPSGLCKGRLDPEDLLVIDLDGNVLRADATRGPCRDLPTAGRRGRSYLRTVEVSCTAGTRAVPTRTSPLTRTPRDRAHRARAGRRRL